MHSRTGLRDRQAPAATPHEGRTSLARELHAAQTTAIAFEDDGVAEPERALPRRCRRARRPSLPGQAEGRFSSGQRTALDLVDDGDKLTPRRPRLRDFMRDA